MQHVQQQIAAARERDPLAWERSQAVVQPAEVSTTLTRLVEAIRTSAYSPPLRGALLRALRDGRSQRIEEVHGDLLKILTGLPPTKAVRALALVFGIVTQHAGDVGVSEETPASIETFLRSHGNPYDWLLNTKVPSLLDLGAGDLSFAEDLVSQYGPQLSARRRPWSLHCLDRLQPGSRWGGTQHADAVRLKNLQSGGGGSADHGGHFAFCGGYDMFALDQLSGVLPRYSIVTCHAPANPTFAFEPGRLGSVVIDEYLRRVKGDFRFVLADGEEALEVRHQGRSLLFPPWKFQVRGPLALFELLANTGDVAVLCGIDNEVFWELLSQLVEDDRVRPNQVPFQTQDLNQVFGDLYRRLQAVPVGSAVRLSDLTALRTIMPRVLPPSAQMVVRPYRFRYVEIRRGALFAGMPAGTTARLFAHMTEEEPPWALVLVPDSRVL